MFEDVFEKAADIVGKGADAVSKGAESVKKSQRESMTVSEDSPLEANGLEVYPDRLKYKKIRCNFKDIEHISWNWVSKTTNGVLNTQTVELTIYIKNSKNISISKTTMYVTPKLVTAYNYIAKATFDTRLKFYTDQLEKTGKFIYTMSGFWGDSHATFVSDGTVQSGDKTFQLSDAYIEAFELTIKQGGMFSSKLTVKLDIDKDIILALINFILENPQKPSDYIRNYKEQKESKRTANSFLTNAVSLMAKLSYADGVISPEEVAVVKDFLTKTMKVENQELSQMITIFNQAKNSPKPFEYFATQLSGNYEVDILYALLDILFLIALADGTISAEEELLLLEAEAIFGIKGSMYNKYKNQKHTHKGSKEDYYFEILGLDSNATKAEIKKTYRRLAMKFHPDKVNHLGEEFIYEAEIKMKEINEAYEYLKNS
jgi:DnaJ like chaperone protein